MLGKFVAVSGAALLGVAAVQLLSDDGGKKAAARVTAAAMRARDGVKAAAGGVKNACSEILADAKTINEQRAQQREAAPDADEPEIIVEVTIDGPEETDGEDGTALP